MTSQFWTSLLLSGSEWEVSINCSRTDHPPCLCCWDGVHSTSLIWFLLINTHNVTRTFPRKHKTPQLLCWPLQLNAHVILEIIHRLNLPSHGTNLHTQHTESSHHQLHLQDQDMAGHKCNTCLESYGCSCSHHSQHFCSETNYKVSNKIMVPMYISVLITLKSPN